jgi:hypothetical protein
METKLPVINLPTGKPHISFSEFSKWSNCSWEHFLAAVKGLDRRLPGPHAEFGTAVHATAEHYLRTRVLDPNIAINMIDARWKELNETPPPELLPEELPKFLSSFSIETVFNGKKLVTQGVDIWKEQAASIVEEIPAFVDSQFPNWSLVDAEHQLYEPIEGSQFKFKGFIDGVIECDPKRGKKRVTWLLDWKTSTSGWFKDKKMDPLTKKQLIFYKHYWCTKNKRDIKDVRCAFVILKRLAKPGTHIDFFPISVGQKPIEATLREARNMIHSVNNGIAIKFRTGCKYCDFFDTKHCDSVFRKI